MRVKILAVVEVTIERIVFQLEVPKTLRSEILLLPFEEDMCVFCLCNPVSKLKHYTGTQLQ